jgi:hypothetical protein
MSNGNIDCMRMLVEAGGEELNYANKVRFIFLLLRPHQTIPFMRLNQCLVADQSLVLNPPMFNTSRVVFMYCTYRAEWTNPTDGGH